MLSSKFIFFIVLAPQAPSCEGAVLFILIFNEKL